MSQHSETERATIVAACKSMLYFNGNSGLRPTNEEERLLADALGVEGAVPFTTQNDRILAAVGLLADAITNRGYFSSPNGSGLDNAAGNADTSHGASNPEKETKRGRKPEPEPTAT